MSDAKPAWECAQSDRPRYLRWVWEVSQLPFTFTAFGASRDPHKLKLARSWKRQLEVWCDKQFWLMEKGYSHAWQYDRPQKARLLQYCGGTEDDIEDGEQLMLELGYYGICDEYKIQIGQPEL